MGTISISTPSDGQTIDAADVNSPLNTIVAAINGNLNDDNIVSGANINGTKLLANSIPPTAGDANFRGGWNASILPAPNTITYNGNRSYSLVFNTVDLTSYISNGMRLKATRTVTAPTQCTSLNGTTQYYSKTSPAGMTFTDTFTASAWVKINAYGTAQNILSRYTGGVGGFLLSINSSGQVNIYGEGSAGVLRSTISYQSIPLNKWVHVAGSLQMSTGVGIAYIDGVSVPVTTSGSGTALVQSGNLQIGSYSGANFFNGKIAQAAVFSSALSAATIQSYISQGLSGTETSLISAYSFNGVITDLNTTNANNLTPNGSAVATNADSPFAGGANASTAYTAGTTEFGEIFDVSFSTNTTVVLQVPDGYAIPTSGGVSAVAYSNQSNPLGCPPPITVIGYVEIMTNFSATALTDLLGLSLSCYIPKGRRVKVSGYVGQASSSIANNGAQMNLVDSTTSSTLNNAFGATNASGDSVAVAPSRSYTPASSGSRSYKAQFNRGANAATANTNSTTTTPSYLMVELVQG